MPSSKHKKIFSLAKGFRGRNKNVYSVAVNKVEKSLQYAYRDRKTKKRDFASLWIQQINAGAREHGITYSKFIHSMRSADIYLNRKVLADIARTEPYSFKAVLDTASSFVTPAVVADTTDTDTKDIDMA